MFLQELLKKFSFSKEHISVIFHLYTIRQIVERPTTISLYKVNTVDRLQCTLYSHSFLDNYNDKKPFTASHCEGVLRYIIRLDTNSYIFFYPLPPESLLIPGTMRLS